MPKITELPSYTTSPKSYDVLPIVDIATSTTRKITVDSFRNYIDSSAYPTLSEADATASSAGKLLVITQNYDITSDTTLSSAIYVPKGGGFTQKGNYTLTINNSFTAGLYQVFFGFSAGDVIFNTGSTKEVYPQWFGAKGDGLADDTLPLRVAIASIRAITTQTGVYVGSSPKLVLPSGIYRITDYITQDVPQAMNYQHIVGDKAIIRASAGVTVFGGVGYNNIIEGISFIDGECAISIRTNNVETVIIIRNCEFHDQTDSCIRTDGYSMSTLLNVYNSKFERVAEKVGHNGYVGKFPTGDKINFFNCWITNGSDCCFYNAGNSVNGGNLSLSNCIGCPIENMNTIGTGRWIDNYGSVVVDNFRFGGEGGGSCLVYNYADIVTTYPINPTSVIIKNCDTYTLDYAIKFYAMPNIVVFTNNRGLIDTKGFYFDPSIPQSKYADFQAYGIFEQSPQELLTGTGIGNAIFIAKQALKDTSLFLQKDRLKISEIMGSGQHGDGWSLISGYILLDYVIDNYGIQKCRITTIADNAYFSYYLDTYLDPSVLECGKIYTLVTQVEIVACTKELIMYVEIGSQRVAIRMTKGQNILNVPFVYLNNTGQANPTYDKICFGMEKIPNATVILLGRHILLSGLCSYKKEILELVTTDVPTAYTPGITYDSGYAVGDIAYNGAVVPSGCIGWVCTTAGLPGTWKTFGAVSA